MAKLDGEFPESDGTQARILEYGATRRDCVGQTQIVGGGNAVHEHSNVVLAGERIDHSARFGRGGLSSEAISARNVIEAPSNAAQFPGSHQTVKRLVHGSARSEIGEVLRTPDADFPLGGKAKRLIRGRQICTSFVRVGKNRSGWVVCTKTGGFPGKRDFLVQILYAAPALWTFWHFVRFRNNRYLKTYPVGKAFDFRRLHQ